MSSCMHCGQFSGDCTCFDDYNELQESRDRAKEKLALLSSENEKLAGMVKEKSAEIEACNEVISREQKMRHEAMREKDAEIASLKAKLELQTAFTEAEREIVGTLSAALTHHREAANVLVGALEDIAADKEFSHTPDGNGGQKFVRKVWYAEFASRALAHYAALTAPQAPEEGKPR